MRIVFFGSGAFGLPTLRRLAADHTLAGLVTQPDRPAGRGGKTAPTPVAAWAAEWAARHAPGLPLLKPERASAAPARDEIRALPADAWVVIAFGQKLSPALLDGRFACNLHASLLPRWRGAAPINAAVLAGDAETGNSVITLADRMDAGAVLAQSRRPIDPAETAGELHDRLAEDGPELVDRVLRQHADNTLRPAGQDESRATLAPKLSKADGWVDLAAPAELARRRVHGLTPWPGVTARFRGEPVKLLRVVEAAGPHGDAAPGAVLDPVEGLIACGQGTALRLLELQPPGKRAMPWRDFANGHRVAAGERFEGRSP